MGWYLVDREPVAEVSQLVELQQFLGFSDVGDCHVPCSSLLLRDPDVLQGKLVGLQRLVAKVENQSYDLASFVSLGLPELYGFVQWLACAVLSLRTEAIPHACGRLGKLLVEARQLDELGRARRTSWDIEPVHGRNHRGFQQRPEGKLRKLFFRSEGRVSDDERRKGGGGLFR